jgi:hypothetical protein
MIPSDQSRAGCGASQRAKAAFALTLAGALLVPGSCALPSELNPSFPLSRARAREELEEMRRNPRGLERPLVVVGGYLDPGLGPWWTARRLRRLTSDDRFLGVEFLRSATFDACRTRLIRKVDEAFPSEDPTWTVEVDVVALSMGGLVARDAAAAPAPSASTARRLRIRRLFTISTPHRGARLARIPCFLPLHRDMQAGSAFLEGLSAREGNGRPELYAYVRLGDRIVGAENAAPPGETAWWVSNPPFQLAHAGAVNDSRILADIARRLRGEEAYARRPAAPLPEAAGGAAPLALDWQKDILTIRGKQLPGGEVKVLYIEAYCRPGSHTADWGRTVIGHRTELLARSEDGTRLELRCTLRDGVVVDHVITAGRDEVDFRLTARNPTESPSEAHWAQPCIRVGEFTGLGDPRNPATYDYLEKCFVFLDGKLARMPTKDWATEARYTPGQVWAAPGVPRADVNPRPLNPHTPSNGLIGCFTSDESLILATAWEPYQELFQGVITCIHSDFRLGGLAPGETKRIRGKIYIIPAGVEALLERYRRDFAD